ncbi:FUSC family protein [Nocardioides currus]|uniref:FUSC family protein n=1 Tax=Nocardioides currus TaxID=2133958 RepID=A0A2R7Z2E9_9ACTN|nr:FUSC family protein [Nocardioides currus]PUA82780.1 FUSC family protein [Nocardioides currus]
MGESGRGESSRPTDLRFGIRDLVRLNPVPPGQHRVALRAGLSVAVPLLAVVLLDRTSWTIYAAFGAFASLYGRNHVHLPRAVMQASAGVALVSAVGLGAVFAAVDGGPWALVAVSAAVAFAGSVVSTVLDWHPSGPLFMIFAFGTVAAAPGAWSDVPTALAVSTASAVFALVVGNVGAVARRTPRPALAQLRSPRSTAPVRYLLAVGVAGVVATVVGIGHPWWATVAAAAPLSVVGRDHQALRAGHRIAGTTLGLLTAAPLLLLELEPVPLVLVVVVLQVVTELLVARNYALALLFITPMALLMGQLGAAQSAGSLLFDRGVETAIGAAVAIGLLAIEHRRATR